MIWNFTSTSAGMTWVPKGLVLSRQRHKGVCLMDLHPNMLVLYSQVKPVYPSSSSRILSHSLSECQLLHLLPEQTRDVITAVERSSITKGSAAFKACGHTRQAESLRPGLGYPTIRAIAHQPAGRAGRRDKHDHQRYSGKIIRADTVPVRQDDATCLLITSNLMGYRIIGGVWVDPELMKIYWSCKTWRY